MPYTLKPNKLFVKDQNGNGYLPQNIVTDESTADAVNTISAAGDSQTNRVNTAGRTQIAAINERANELDSKLDEADEAISKIDSLDDIIAGLRNLLDLVHPVGSVYISLDSTNPGTMFGGTWEQIKGRFLIATGEPDGNTNHFFGDNLTYDNVNKYNARVGEMGGESMHTLSVGELPSHNHTPFNQGDWRIAEFRNTPNKSGIWGAALNVDMSGLVLGSVNDGTNYIALQSYTGSTGNNSPHNNLPPYLGVYMWKRTA